MVERELNPAFWADFPHAKSPRPLILLSSKVDIGEGGFVDGAAKLAWMQGAITASITIPNSVRELLPPNRSQHAPILTITDIRHTEAGFVTDRGPRQMAVHSLTVTGLKSPCVVLDPALDLWWPRDELRSAGSAWFDHAVIENDDLTVHLPAFGGVLTQFHRAEFVEYDSYVVGRAITTEKLVPLNQAVHLSGVMKRVTGRLAAPLGGRVLIGQRGDPIEVLAPGLIEET